MDAREIIIVSRILDGFTNQNISIRSDCRPVLNKLPGKDYAEPKNKKATDQQTSEQQ
jgi:hypothetical protein